MKHRTSARFWRCYRNLPEDIRALADRSYALLKADPAHRSLHFKRIASLRSVRVGLHHRALAAESGAELVWFWIGSHAHYDKLLGRKATGKQPRFDSRTDHKDTTTRNGRKERG